MTIVPTRRDLGVFLATLPMMLGSISMSVAQTKKPTVPDVASLQSGDFVLPRKPDAWVPYIDRGNGQSTPAEDELEWNAGKEKFLATVKDRFSYFSDQDIETIRRLSFAEFYAAYVGTPVPSEPMVLQFGLGLYVGHVGIIEVDQSKNKWVIEALGGKGVIKQRYEDWINGRPGQWIWAGRLKDPSPDKRKLISEEAAKYIGRPYNFWNLDLDDDREFYCSKLVWMAIYRSPLHIAVDGNSNPRRLFWFSPKQLLYSSAVDEIFSPGEHYIR
jgi:permuted papain-like amidase YaeF/Yiix C92 family enzyme